MKRFKKGPSPAMIVAMVALVVAMGGSAYAATKIGTKQIKNGAVTQPKLSSGLKKGSIAAYASIDGFGPTIQGSYKKNVTGVTRAGTGLYCLAVDWAAAGRTPASQATPVVVSPRNPDHSGGGDYYPSGTCGSGEVTVQLENRSGTSVDGWVTVLIP